jgi:hypothetical protein
MGIAGSPGEASGRRALIGFQAESPTLGKDARAGGAGKPDDRPIKPGVTKGAMVVAFIVSA